MITALRDAGIQAGRAAVLTVDAERQTVRLDWTVQDEQQTAKTDEEGS